MTFKAVVKGGAAILPPDADVADGTEVEVRVEPRYTTLGEVLDRIGTWHGDDADEIIELIYRSRSGSKPPPVLD